jgi:putative flippase GtrA
MRFIDASVPRFLAAGTLNTALTYVAYLLLLKVSPYRAAFTLSFMLGIVISYVLSTRFVFRRPATRRSMLRFPLICVAQYLLGLLLVSLCVSWLGMPTWMAPLAALVLTIPLTYLLTRTLLTGRQPS